MNAAWQQYVTSLCADAWELHPNATEEVLRKIGALAETGMLTKAAVALVLYQAGVGWPEADAVAPSIRSAVLPTPASAPMRLYAPRFVASTPRPFWHPRASGMLHPIP